MILRNYTPFSPIFFESRTPHGRDFYVVALRGTFQIVPFSTIQPAPEQRPIVEADVYHGEPNCSSVFIESDLAPYKPKSDIHVNAVAHAPGGRPLSSWPVHVRIGNLNHCVRVTGPRSWVRDGKEDFHLTEPEPCIEVPVRYELAFGGVWKNVWGQSDVCQENPIGLGYLRDGEMPDEDVVQAPQIESPEDPIGDIGIQHRPVGLGPIARAWLPRRSFAGTYDNAWLAHRWPNLPEDFDPRHHNSAHPALIYPGHLCGDEEVVLNGLRPTGTQRFNLPGYWMVLMVHLGDGRQSFAPMLLDTLFIDAVDQLVYLTWRGSFPASARINVVDIEMGGAGHG